MRWYALSRVAFIPNSHEVEKHAFSISKLMLPGPSCHQKTCYFMIEIQPKRRQNPTKMASVWLALAPGRPERRKTENSPRLATTGVPFGVPFYDNLARWLPKGGP